MSRQLALTDLFGNPVLPETKRIFLKRIEARYTRGLVCENAPLWMTSKFTQPSQIFEMFNFLRDEAKEHFIVLHLDGKNRISCFDRVSTGSLNQTIVHPREVFKTALISSAAAIVILHNHPTGDPSPSREDMEITRRLKEAGELLGIRILDHIIVGDRYYSFAEEGII